MPGEIISEIKSECWATSSRIRGRLPPESAADCVVVGFRWHKKGAGTMIGSLLLGLYDDDHTLHHVGVAAAVTATMRKQLVVELMPLRADALEDQPGGDWAVHRRKPARRDGGGPVRPAGGTAGKI